MDEHQIGVPDVLLHAACGLPAVPAAGQLSSLLLGGGGGASTDVFGLQPAEVCRVILHAGSQLNQLEVRGLGVSVCTAQQHQYSRAPPRLRCHHHSCQQPLSFCICCCNFAAPAVRGAVGSGAVSCGRSTAAGRPAAPTHAAPSRHLCRTQVAV